MPRRKISEYRAKKILIEELGQEYYGLCVSKENINKIKLGDTKYVVKVDQAIKKRGKSGLVSLNLSVESAIKELNRLLRSNYSYCLVEPFVKHNRKSENFISMNLKRNGIELIYSPEGGINVEKNNNYKYFLIKSKLEIKKRALECGLDPVFLGKLYDCFNNNSFCTLEINPLVIKEGVYNILDLAVEVDDAANLISDKWNSSDFRSPPLKSMSKPEMEVEKLNSNSQASFKLELLNSDGSIFILLSGGGASVTLADEVQNLGYGKQLANYGEYSGGPNKEETAHYTRQLLELMKSSKATDKVIIIAGGVANFTNVQTTFKGILATFISEVDFLKDNNVKIFVRRGGPSEKEGLHDMKSFIQNNNIEGLVCGSEIVLTEIVRKAIGVIK